MSTGLVQLGDEDHSVTKGGLEKTPPSRWDFAASLNIRVMSWALLT
jgi:hypothetical protein